MKHVGGHSNKSWTDQGALEEIISLCGGTTMLDIGCGPGGQIEIARSLGLEAYGLDGDSELEGSPYIQIMDFAKDKATADSILSLPDKGYFDIGWSAEFLEHVEERYMPNYMGAFALCKVIVITHATPGQGGYHHVNEQLFEYWKEKFGEYGFEEDPSLTERVREASTMRTKKINHFIKFEENGFALNERKRSSFMKKTGRVLVNKAL